MEQEKKQAVALMRYLAIAPLITGTQEDYESLSAYFRTSLRKRDQSTGRIPPALFSGNSREMVPFLQEIRF